MTLKETIENLFFTENAKRFINQMYSQGVLKTN